MGEGDDNFRQDGQGELHREGEGVNHAHSGKMASAKEEILRTLLAFGGVGLYLE